MHKYPPPEKKQDGFSPLLPPCYFGVIIAGDLVMGSKVRACPLKLNYYYMLEYLCDNKRGDGAAQLVFKIELVQYM